MKRARLHSHDVLIGAAIWLSCSLALAVPAHAQDHAPAPRLSIELNAMQQVDGACRIVFLAANRLGADLSALSYETVLINTDGVVDRLTLFDFQGLPVGRQRVRQFDLDGVQCASIGQILINGAASCAGDGLTGAECIDELSVSSRTATEISG